uniref:Twinfilin-1 n=1 Tax=Aceria tosichella TaxID=561515 RepID=A0A6G1SMT0_9ACAR
MSHQTGIHASDELKVIFAKCKSQRDIRCLKLSIDKEKLICDETRPMSISNLDWKQDWRTYMVDSFLPKQKPCYVLFRMASGNDNQDIKVISTPAAPAPSPPAATTTTTSSSKSSSGKTSFVSKLAGPPKLSSILTKSLSSNNSNNNNNNNSSSNNNCNNGETKADATNLAEQSIADDASKDQWLFVSWTPESSAVRDKMIYASTKSTVKQEFGSGSIFADYFITCSEDLSVDAVTKYIERKQHIRDGHIDMNELSLSEQELQQVKLDEAALCADLIAAALNSKDKQNKSLPNIEMPIADEAITALYDFKQGKSAYIQFSIDPKSETILLEKNESANGFDLSKKSIASLTPKDHARYHLVSYNHQHNKKQTKATLFIYSIPSSGCPVKERMLYSSVKNSLLQVIQNESKIGINVDRRIETDDPSELTEKFLYDELYPANTSQATPTAFVKPKGPSKQTPSSRRRVL